MFKNKKLALLLVLPQAVITLIFFFWPAFWALVESFYQSDAFGLHSHFVGLTNFKDLLSSNVYIETIGVTILFSFLVTFLAQLSGLGVALLVQRLTVGRTFFKGLFVWPYAVAPAVSAMLWRFIFDPAIGWGAYVLKWLGISWNYLLYPKQALLMIVIASSWQQFSYNFLFYFAALNAIPKSLIEAASLDGASGVDQFRHIIFPLLTPMTFYLLVINLIYAFFDTFGVIQVITQGGPARSTVTMVFKVYSDGFIGMDFPSSAAQSVILMAVVMGLTLLQFTYLDKKVHYR